MVGCLFHSHLILLLILVIKLLIKIWNFLLDINKRRSWLSVSRNGGSNGGSKEGSKSNSVVTGPTAANRRGRFIVLGSSGECLPVNRRSQLIHPSTKTSLQHCDSNSIYSSCDSGGSDDEEEYHSARTSFEDCAEGKIKAHRMN